MATPATNTLPLAEELGLVKYLSNLTGVGSDSNAGTYTASRATAGQAPRLTSDDLSNMMTEWLRGNGRFLESMREQNMSGLYNSSSRRLVANDLMAQAALKAAGANQQLDIQNANLQTQTELQNAKQADTAALNNSTVQARNRSSRASSAETALAALIAAYNKYSKGKDKGKEDKGGGTTDKAGSAELTPDAGTMTANAAAGQSDYQPMESPDFGLTTAQSMGNQDIAMNPGAGNFTPFGDFTSLFGGGSSVDMGGGSTDMGGSSGNFELPDFDFGGNVYDTEFVPPADYGTDMFSAPDMSDYDFGTGFTGGSDYSYDSGYTIEDDVGLGADWDWGW